MVNDAFFSLTAEKQKRIINSGLEVFAKNAYKKASTDEIAAKAQISKGSLFYYFRNKKEFYTFLFDYGNEFVKEAIAEIAWPEISDFFELMEKAALAKVKFLAENPYLIDFYMRAYYAKNEEVASETNRLIQQISDNIMAEYFQKIDVNKFKPGVNPERIFKMLVWLTDGYLHEYERSGDPLDLDAMITEFKIWTAMLKTIAYKEEYCSEHH